MTTSTATEKRSNTIKTAIHRILRPLVGFLLRNGVDCPGFEEEVRRVYVEVALKKFTLKDRKPSISRAATLTGLSRKEVARLLHSIREVEDTPLLPHNRASAVVAGWVRDPDFQDGRAQPRPLSRDDKAGGFPALVKRYSGDMPARAVFDELHRVGAIEVLDDGRAVLTRRAYVPSRDDTAKIEIFGTDVSCLMETISHNLDCAGENARYQRKVLYDNLSADDVAAFRRFAAERSQSLLEEFDRYLAEIDQGAEPLPVTERFRAGVGIFYIEKTPETDPPLPGREGSS
jgi:hypothetical protein